VARAQVAKEVLRADAGGTNLLKPAAWRGMKNARQQNDEFICENGTDAKVESGFSQTVVLNQKTPQPIVAAAWSKADNVGGTRDSDYSLYLDLQYMDGEPLWGQTALFKVGTHDWEKAEVRVMPAKPVKHVSVNLLLRRHTGAARFRQPQLFQVEPQQGAASFDGQIVLLKTRAADGFQVRDVAAGSDYVAFQNGAALGLTMDVQSRNERGATFFTATLRDTTNKDRAVTLIYSAPAAGEGWAWCGPRAETPCRAPQEYLDVSRSSAGSGVGMSRYPLAAITREGKGQALALDMDRPAFFRVGYSAGAGELYIAYDLALTPEKPAAEISFRAYTFDASPGFGFRAAVEKLYELFPDHFRCRTPKQGIWMPFHKISAVENWQDFGFKFKEGDNETAWDDAHDMITFRYTEPLTWWMRMPKDAPRTMDAAVAEAKRLAEKGDKSAQALLTSGYHNEDGQFVAQIRKEPWCDGCVWSMNSSPGVAGDVNDFKNKWNAPLREQLYGKARKADLDGEYVDSSEGWVTDELDFRREHLATARAPLVFATGSHRPAVLRGLIAYEYVRAMSDDVHGMGKLMMANATPIRLPWLAPWLDVMGTETDWNHGGKWRPMSDDEMLYRRVICGPKPYCFLMNTNFDQFSHELVEKYMQRSLAYGMFPGFFSHNASEGHYFSQPALYNRDRDLFKKYVPLCQRVAEAGWRPMTGARSNDPKVYVERFGASLLTVFNDSGEKKDVTITFLDQKPARCKELVRGAELQVKDGAVQLTLGAEEVGVVEVGP
jgi:hypothetical protein